MHGARLARVCRQACRVGEASRRCRPEPACRVRAAHQGELPANFDATIADYKKKLAADKPKVATRKSSEMALEVINGVVPETIGGSADLTGSNNTKTSQTKAIAAGRLRQSLRSLRHPRARHGRGHERPVAAWRHHPVWRHLPVLLRLCAAGDAAGLADGHPLDLRDDARFHRPRRGRPDAPAGRASGRAARHSQPSRLPPGRRDRGRGMLAARAGIDQGAVDARADPPEPADGAH